MSAIAHIDQALIAKWKASCRVLFMDGRDLVQSDAGAICDHERLTSSVFESTSRAFFAAFPGAKISVRFDHRHGVFSVDCEDDSGDREYRANDDGMFSLDREIRKRPRLTIVQGGIA
ncbi:hypothetical protein CCR95_20885 [Thiocystis minor]|uniref:hypothetical protein n=1 Tax=Thiocystis minor TaxID=61597 RepID=UPI0019117771|nr:hypothetical protein [Thiocystis minor]MBK5966462.1 hypothetical protein [Thiocystis minor]